MLIFSNRWVTGFPVNGLRGETGGEKGSWPSREDHESFYPQDLQDWSWMGSLFLGNEDLAWGAADTSAFTSANAQVSEKGGDSALAKGKDDC